jgi:chromate reductase, NAD(P)H dehydrogenase (quinone)
MSVPKILVIPGSLDSRSYNVRLAALAAKELALAQVDVTRISLADYPLPLFDPDTDDKTAPPHNAVLLRRMIEAHQGVFIASPEYSASVTPLVINAIDWVSRVRGRGEPAYAAFKNRVFAIAAASSEPGGGPCSLIALRQILELGCGALVIPDQITIAYAAEAFDEMDNLKDPRLAAALKVLLRRFIDLVGAVA